MTGDIWDLIHFLRCVVESGCRFVFSLKYCRGSDGDERRVRDKVDMKNITISDCQIFARVPI